MSLEAEVKKLTEAVVGLTAVLSANQAQPPSAPPALAPAAPPPRASAAAATDAPTATPSPTAPVAAAAPAPQPAAPAKGPTIDEVKAITTKLAAFGHPDSTVGREIAVALLKEYGGAVKASEIPTDKYAEYLGKAKSKLATLELAR